jgi:hypothetical protein
VLHHRVELQLVTGPRLVRRERPRHRIEGEVVVLVLGTSRRPPFRGHLVVQQDLEALKNSLTRVDERDVEPRLQIEPAIAQVDRVNQNLRILRHTAILLLRQLRLDPLDDCIALRALFLLIRERGIPDQRVVLTEALRRPVFGVMGQAHIDQHLGVAIAVFDPRLSGDQAQRHRQSAADEQKLWRTAPHGSPLKSGVELEQEVMMIHRRPRVGHVDGQVVLLRSPRNGAP